MFLDINNLNLIRIKQSTPLSQKLASYSAFAAALTGFASSAEAQIVHVNNADVVVGLDQSQSFDLDGDGNKEVTFRQSHYFSAWTSNGNPYSSTRDYNYANNIGSNTKILAKNNYGWVKPLNSNDNIQADNSIFATPSYLGYFSGQGEKFVGIKFSGDIPGGGTENYIGWIRISVTGDRKSMTILDWAYTPYTDPSASILAGQTSVPTSIKPEVVASLLNVSVTPTKVTDKVSISTQDAASFIITSMAGTVVTQGELVAGENSVNTSQLTKGIYLVKVNSSNGSAVKRIVKE